MKNNRIYKSSWEFGISQFTASLLGNHIFSTIGHGLDHCIFKHDAGQRNILVHVILSDIYSEILYFIYILTFHLAFYLTCSLIFYLTYILTSHLALYLTFLLTFYLIFDLCVFCRFMWHSIWHSTRHIFWHPIQDEFGDLIWQIVWQFIGHSFWHSRHMSSVQNESWLMISSGIILPFVYLGW